MHETATDRKRKLHKLQIIDYLTDKGVYTEAYDYIIDMLIDQVQLYHESRELINTEGLSVAGSGAGTFTVRNQHTKTLTECIANIQKLSKMLGLSVADSIIFKQLNDTSEDDDGFDSDSDFSEDDL